MRNRFSISRLGSRSRQRGLSLVELMVAMTIGLFLMGAVGMLYVNTATSSRASSLESQMNEDAALALELLQQQIQLAGFSSVSASGQRTFAGRAVFGCDGPFVNGSSNFNALACNPAPANGASDELAVRYEASALNSQTVAGGAPANCAFEGITAWDAFTAPNNEGAAAATPMILADNRYYVANDANGVPSLFCRGRTGTGFGNATALIPNVENMQIQYAVTSLPTAGKAVPHQVAGYAHASTAPNPAVAGSPTVTVMGLPVPGTGVPMDNWSRVAAIRICLLVRSANPVPAGDTSQADLNFYRDCDGNDVTTATDRRLRRAYVTTIQLRNMRPGLPAAWDPTKSANPPSPWAYLYE